MASQSYISIANILPGAFTVTASSAIPGYPAANLAEPERLGLPWRSTSTGVQTIVIDQGSAVAYDRIALVGVNFSAFSVQNHTANSWGAPAYDSGSLTTSYDPDYTRYRRWVLPGSGGAAAGAFTRQYTRIVIPSQATTDGAVYFEIAGIWMGIFLQLPRSPRPGYTRTRVRPRLIKTADLGRWSISYVTGDQSLRHHYTRFAEKNPVTPGVGDEWATWLNYDREIASYGIASGTVGGRFGYIAENWGAGAFWVMRQENEPNWQDHDLVFAEDDWDLVEAVAG